MKSLLLHGCYDQPTLDTLKNLGVVNFGFDLRARSLNLIPLKQLRLLLTQITSEQVVLMFENELPTTIYSLLNLLSDQPFKFKLEFRDNMPATFYRTIDQSFYWMFQPESDWQQILELPKCEGVLLPLKWQSDYFQLAELWNIIERRNLKFFLHADNFSQASLLSNHLEVEVSLDLTSEVESSYRLVDQEKLRKIKFWRTHHENSAGQ